MTSTHNNHLLELWTVLLLSIAGVTTSWSGYQASLWDGDQAALYSMAAASRQKAALNGTRGGQARIIDGLIFMQWLSAKAENHPQLEIFYKKHFRPEFIPAFQAWLDSNPHQNPEAEATPFSMPQYRVAYEEKAKQLNEEADKQFHSGQSANNISDRYVKNTVILAMVMFFAGIAQQFQKTYIRVMVLSIAMLMLTIGSYFLFTYPIAEQP